jgi:drug/metabolite transporter superfamily protein YnfA
MSTAALLRLIATLVVAPFAVAMLRRRGKRDAARATVFVTVSLLFGALAPPTVPRFFDWISWTFTALAIFFAWRQLRPQAATSGNAA